MEPKFQSSFIPKGPTVTSGMMPTSRPIRKGGIFGYIAIVIFVISVVLAVGVFAYKFYLENRISKIGQELETARAGLYPETIDQFIDLDNRINSTKTLVENHTAVLPLFDFLESSTLKNVRFTELSYADKAEGIEIRLRGQARGYSILALQSDAFNNGPYFKNPVFSNLTLDDKGNIIFSYQANVDPKLLSYKKTVSPETVPQVPVSQTSVSRVNLATTTTSTSTTPVTGTTTPKN